MKIVLHLPEDGAEISFMTLAQRLFLTDPYRAADHVPELEPRTVDETVPGKVRFDWYAEGAGSELQISGTPDFREYRRFPAEKSIVRFRAKGPERDLSVFSAEINNLPHGEKYYWRAEAEDGFSEVRSFTVAPDLPRWIDLPRVTNVRDLGGWKTQDGRTIRQGMVFRGAQFEAWTSQKSYDLTDDGREVLFNVLKIRTELDLRGKEPLLPREHSLLLPMSAYATWKEFGIFTPEQMENYRRIFELFTRPAVYPVYFHCQGGGDRTGTLAFMLEAMLGMSLDDMITEYELSNLSVSGERSRFSEVWVKFMEKLESLAPGKSRNDQAREYLRQCGVTDEMQEKIKSILLK